MRHTNETIVEMLKGDKKLRVVHLRSAIETLVEGDTRTGLVMLRNIVNATCGFQKLSRETKVPEKSLMRMLSAGGNPSTTNLFGIIHCLTEYDSVHISVSRGKAA